MTFIMHGLSGRGSTATLPAAAGRPCSHTRHIGSCSACQRAQLARWAEQLRLAEVARFARGSSPRRAGP
jgi:hypothetical protein